MPSFSPATREMRSSLACCAIAMSDAILLSLLPAGVPRLAPGGAAASTRTGGGCGASRLSSPRGPRRGRGDAAAAAKGRAMIACAAPPGEDRRRRRCRHIGLTALPEEDTFVLIGMKKREVGRLPVGSGCGGRRRSGGGGGENSGV